MTERRLYLDANVFIYAIEGSAEVSNPLHELFGLLRSRNGAGVTSELTLAEVLPKANSAQRRNYLDLLIRSRIFDLHPVSREILIETAEYRKFALTPKLPDAIHLVTAIRAGCRTILSADSRLKLPEGYTALRPNPENLSRLIRELS
jgi:predicted nucleic acid-binding protein